MATFMASKLPLVDLSPMAEFLLLNPRCAHATVKKEMSTLKMTGALFSLLFLCMNFAVADEWPRPPIPHLIKLDYTRNAYIAHSLSRSAPSVMTQSGPVSLAPLYQSKTTDIEVLFGQRILTHDRVVIDALIGGSSGQEAPKLYIQSSAKFGLSGVIQTSQLSVLKFWAITTIGGHLKERPCEADYGPFGVHKVKCSMADSTMPPSQTLAYLTNIKPYNAHQINLSWTYYFD